MKYGIVIIGLLFVFGSTFASVMRIQVAYEEYAECGKYATEQVSKGIPRKDVDCEKRP